MSFEPALLFILEIAWNPKIKYNNEEIKSKNIVIILVEMLKQMLLPD